MRASWERLGISCESLGTFVREAKKLSHEASKEQACNVLVVNMLGLFATCHYMLPATPQPALFVREFRRFTGELLRFVGGIADALPDVSWERLGISGEFLGSSREVFAGEILRFVGGIADALPDVSWERLGISSESARFFVSV